MACYSVDKYSKQERRCDLKKKVKKVVGSVNVFDNNLTETRDIAMFG